MINNDELITGCIAGERKYQIEFFHKYKVMVLQVISKYLGAGFDKDDILQQAFVKIYKSLNNFKGLSSLDTWVYRITTKVCIDQLRKKYRKRQLEMVDNPIAVDNHHDSQSDTPLDLQEKKELSEHIEEALNKLKVEKRIVVTMFEMEGFSLEEIAQITEKPIGTVKSRLFHGRKELAIHLSNYLGKEK